MATTPTKVSPKIGEVEQSKPSSEIVKAQLELSQWDLQRKKFVDKIVIFSCSAFGIFYFSALFFVFVASPTENYLLVKVFFGQFPITVGLPGAAAMAFFVVWAFEVTVGRMELKLGEFVNFKGAATPTLFWVVCFLSIGYMINLNWLEV